MADIVLKDKQGKSKTYEGIESVALKTSDGGEEIFGGSSLPEVTSEDNGKVLGVVNGAWAKTNVSAITLEMTDSEALVLAVVLSNAINDMLTNPGEWVTKIMSPQYMNTIHEALELATQGNIVNIKITTSLGTMVLTPATIYPNLAILSSFMLTQEVSNTVYVVTVNLQFIDLPDESPSPTTNILISGSATAITV